MPSYKVNLRAGEPASIQVTAEEANDIADAIKQGKNIVSVVHEYTNDGKPSSDLTVIPVSNIASVVFYDAGRQKKKAVGVRIE